MLKARAGVTAISALVAGRAKLRIVIDLAEFDILTGERTAMLLAPLAADHLERAGRAVQAVVLLFSAGDAEDVEEVALVGAAVHHDHRAAVRIALRVRAGSADVDRTRERAV